MNNAFNWGFFDKDAQDFRHKKTSTKLVYCFLAYKQEMVPEDGLEPSRPKATDFESVVSTNSTTPATQ